MLFSMMYRSGPTPAGTCPRCRETLLAVEGMEGVKWCDHCGGVLADAAASQRATRLLDRLLLDISFQAARGRPKKADDGRRISCPECLVEMEKVRVEAAACEIDACPSHGTWFDSGELADVMRAFARARKHGGLPPLPTRAAAQDQPFGKAETKDDSIGTDVGELLGALFTRP
jgi:Zn-finger nucleic acid-binding protein